MNQKVIIQDLKEWLENNLDKSLSLDHVAAKSGYSKWHLQRMFRNVTGDALGTYIRTRRLSRAASELCLKDHSILDIALQSGFDSQQSFSRAFKRQFSQTPGAYRSQKTYPYQAEGARDEKYIPAKRAAHEAQPVF
ncbi:helix-turn-helix domain-containing protein [Enterobacteriales bacterium SAP-6]|uniref:Helix-turn-helix domain-containing protein n=1 Tax=Acerihabitans arboris TaxID=2691583 RepID=A0A845SJH9_9GAMM|nr:helix-turn-helix domain-containing protein [Acerihabitans arboris]